MAKSPGPAGNGGGTGQWEEGTAVEPQGVVSVFPGVSESSSVCPASTTNPDSGPQPATLDETQTGRPNGSTSLRTTSPSLCTADAFCVLTAPRCRDTEDEMDAAVNGIPLADRSRSLSNDCLTESTVFSLSQSESLWTTESSRSPWEIYQYPILLLATGGAVFICGCVLSGLFFADIAKNVTNILGPALLSIGLMVLVVGLVLVPITKENQKPPMRRPITYYKPPQFNL